MTARARIRWHALLAIAVLILIGWQPAHADQDKTFTWQIPTLRDDGSALPAGALTNYDLACDPVSGTRAIFATWAITDQAESSRAFTFADGGWYCALRVYEGAIFSAWSNEVFFSNAPPAAPGGLTVTSTP